MGISNGKLKIKKIKIKYNKNKDLLCYKCGLISEILNFHADNKEIEFNCKKCGIYEVLINKYLDRLSEINFYKICSSCKVKDFNKKYFFCFTCKKDYCESCKNKYHSKDHSLIEVDKKEIVYKEFEYFCFDCYENFGIEMGYKVIK